MKKTRSKQQLAQIRKVDAFLRFYHASKMAWLRTAASDRDIMVVSGVADQEARRLSGGETHLPDDDPRYAEIANTLAMLHFEAQDAEQRFIAWAREQSLAIQQDGTR